MAPPLKDASFVGVRAPRIKRARRGGSAAPDKPLKV